MLGILSLLVLLCFRKFIFGDQYYIFKGIGVDTLNALYPYVYNTTEFFERHEIPTWSFNYGMGQNTFPLFLRDPFDIFLYILGRRSILPGTVYLEIIKILLTGTVFFKFLELLNLNFLAKIVGSLCYSLCSYMIIGGVWHFFSFECLELALLLLSFELLLQRNNLLLVPVPFFFIGLTMPLNLYFFGIFLAVYGLLRLAQLEQLNLKKIIHVTAGLLGGAMVGLMVSGPFLIQNLSILFSNPRVGGNNSYFNRLFHTPVKAYSSLLALGTYLLRFFSNDLLGTPVFFSGQMNTFEAPMFYCGIPSLLLAPQIFPFLNRKNKIIYAVIFLAWLVPIFFPWFRFAFWLFTGNYFRVYSFFVSVIFLLYSVSGLSLALDSKRINVSVLIVTAVFWIIVLYYPYFNTHTLKQPGIVYPERVVIKTMGGRNIIDTWLQGFILVLIVSYSCLLYLLNKPGNNGLIKVLFLGVLTFELFQLTDLTVNGWEPTTKAEYSKKIGYNDYTIEATNYLSKHDSSFYRIEKKYFSSMSSYFSLNDGLMQDYHGTTSYGSFNQMYYINYLQTIGIMGTNHEAESRWSKGVLYQPVTESENRVKYFLSKSGLHPSWFLLADSIASFGDVTVYKNNLVLPFGFTYDHFIREKEFRTLDKYNKTCYGLLACVVKDTANCDGLKELSFADKLAVPPIDSDTIVNEIRLLQAQTQKLTLDTLALQQHTETQFSGTISAHKDEVLFLSIPYDKGWKLKIDGKPSGLLILSGGMTGVKLAPGMHSIELSYQLQGMAEGIFLSIVGIIMYFLIWYYSIKMSRRSTDIKSLFR